MGKTLQQRYEFNNSIGMNAYSNHKEPSEEMKNIWEVKEALIKSIIEKYGKPKYNIDCLTPEDLSEILYNGYKKEEKSEGILNVYL